MNVHSITADAGTGATASLLGNDRYGSVVLTTGTGASNAGAQFALYFDDPVMRSRYANVELALLNGAAQSSDAYVILENPGSPNTSATGFDVHMAGTVADNTVYEFAYRVS